MSLLKEPDSPKEAANNSSLCLDLSIKQIWLIVHFAECDPGNEFEIVSDKQLVGDSWETLTRGVEVAIAYGNAKVQATVLTVSGKVSEKQADLGSVSVHFNDFYKLFPCSDKTYLVWWICET